MSEPTLNYVTCADNEGGHRTAYWQWGDVHAGHLVVCAHGLSRQGRDFDEMARALLAKADRPLRIVCPDVAGRGRSDWLRDPMAYQFPTYAADMLALLGQLHAQVPIAALDWVGTSMGGIIGMILAGTPNLALPVPIRRLVLNDVGPVIEWSALQRIGAYLGSTTKFDSLQQAADEMWRVSTSFGPHTAAQWLELSRAMIKSLPGGGFTFHYDPAIAVSLHATTEEATVQGQVVLWQLYDGIRAQTLITRGAQSDLLSLDTAQGMTQRGPHARLVEFEGVGHAPTFVDSDQADVVASFLLELP